MPTNADAVHPHGARRALAWQPMGKATRCTDQRFCAIRPTFVILLFVAILLATAGCSRSVPGGGGRFVHSDDVAAAPFELVPSSRVETGRLVTSRSEVSEPSRRVGGTYPGTDRFSAPPAGGGTVGYAAETTGPVSLNFVETDLREVIKAILGDLLGENYVVDPEVQGTVTLQTSRPMSRPELINALDDVLSINGAALVQSDGLFKVLPKERAASAGLASSGVGSSRVRGSGIQVVPLRFISAIEMEEVLKPFTPPSATVRVDPDRNLLILGGTPGEREQLLELVRTFDVDWLEGMSFAIQPIQSGSAEAMVDDLDQIFRTNEGGRRAGLVRFVPVDRLNAILVMSPRRELLAKAQTWIRRLDAGDSDEPRVYVYYCQNTRAEELADVLNQIFNEASPATTATPRRELAPGFEAATIGDDRLGSRESIEFARAGETDAFGQAYQVDGGAEAGVPPRRPPTLAARGPGSFVSPEPDDIRIIADPIKNALVIRATPQDYRKVEAALQRLDVQSLQVLIEATFVEVGLTDDLAFGTQWRFESGGSTFTLPDLVSGVTGVSGFFSWALTLNDSSIRATLQAIQTVTETNIVSSPNMLVLDNQEARIQVGGEEPVPTRTSQSVISPDAPIVSSIEYRETGTILSVIPRVNDSGLVTLEIIQEVSDVDDQPRDVGGTFAPAFTQRTVQSTVAVHDGESVVLGGQIFDASGRTDSGVPWFSQIPIIGFLFGTQASTFERTELVVIITPRVVRDRGTARQATDSLNQRMRRLRPILEEFRVKGVRGG